MLSPLALRGDRALDLVGRGGGSQDEILRQADPGRLGQARILPVTGLPHGPAARST